MTAEDYLKQSMGTALSDLIFKLAFAQAEIDRLNALLAKATPTPVPEA